MLLPPAGYQPRDRLGIITDLRTYLVPALIIEQGKVQVILAYINSHVLHLL